MVLNSKVGETCPPTVHCSILAKILVGALLLIPALNYISNEQPNLCSFSLFLNCTHCRLEQERRLVVETGPRVCNLVSPFLECTSQHVIVK